MDFSQIRLWENREKRTKSEEKKTPHHHLHLHPVRPPPVWRRSGMQKCRRRRHVMTGKVDREGLKKRKEGKREERHLGDMLTPGGMRSAERRRT